MGEGGEYFSNGTRIKCGRVNQSKRELYGTGAGAYAQADENSKPLNPLAYKI